jgi:hypothetical protein
MNQLSLTANTMTRRLTLNFSTPTSVLSLAPEAVAPLAGKIVEHVTRYFGRPRFVSHDNPFKPRWRRGNVELSFPCDMTALKLRPEAALALAVDLHAAAVGLR